MEVSTGVKAASSTCIVPLKPYETLQEQSQPDEQVTSADSAIVTVDATFAHAAWVW
jgi:hypothetical protein